MTRDPRERRPARSVGQLYAAFGALRHPWRSARGRLMAIVLLTTVTVLLVSGIAFLAHDLSVYRASWAADVATEANILGLSTAPAMAFDDRDVAARNLVALEARPSVLAAALYTPDGRLYARYVRSGRQPPPDQIAATGEGVTMVGERVEIKQRIAFNGEFLGTLYLRACYDVAGRVWAYVGIFAAVTVLSLLLALMMSASLQRSITVPLEEIAEVAQGIVHRRDYSLRVPKVADDEIGIVVQALNNMLDEMQTRAQALEASNASLLQQVAERQAAEAALARANARLQTTMGAAEIGSWVRDFKTDEVIADDNFAALFGSGDAQTLSRDQALRHRQIPPEDLAAIDRAHAQARVTGTLASTEFRILQPGGGLRWVIARGKVQFDARGEPALLAGLLIDITPQKLAEQALRESEKIYRAIGESIDYGVWLTDAQGRNTYASDSFLKLTGLTQAQCSGSGWGEMLHSDDVQATMAAWQDCASKGEIWYREHRMLGADGAYHPILAQGVPIRRDDGSIYAWAGINLDISRMKRTEDALREADRRKDDFLATLAHELRNPLAPIRHATHLMGHADATDTQRQWGRDVIARQVQHMALLLDDLLDVSRITRGRLELKKAVVSLADLVASAQETARPLIDAKQHTLLVGLPAEPVELEVDALRISQALSNLLTNAAKYTDANGRIILETQVTTDGLDISVSDTGIGLTADALRRVFEMFSQVESALERSQGGLGIGLALAQGLVGLHGGSLDAQSDGLGHGSVFTIHLPASALVARPPPAVADAPVAGSGGGHSGRVLVADDNRDAVDSLALLLRFVGFEVVVAYSGREALDAAIAVHPQAMVLDIGMPGLTGYEVARAIREQPWGHEVLLIAVTGWGQQEDVEQALSAGFDHHARKPVNLEDLQSRLTAFCARQKPAS